MKPHTERQDGYTYTLSYGGGVNSTALLIEILERKLPLDNVVFADVGFELPETMYFINNYFVPYCIKNNVKFSVVRKCGKNGSVSIVEYFMKGFRVPDLVFRDCTRANKVEPIHKFYKKQLKAEKVFEYIGFHAGEDRRVKPSKTAWVTKCYPLVEYGIYQEGCKMRIKKAGLPVPPKSGCPNCFARSKRTYYKLYKEHPDLFEKSIEIEENYLHNKTKRGLKFYYYKVFGEKPTRLLDLKKEFEGLTSLDAYMMVEGNDQAETQDAQCRETCQT